MIATTHKGAIVPYRWLPRLIIAMAVLPLIIGAAILWSVEKRLVADAGQGLAMAATNIAGKLDMLLHERMNDIQVLAQAPALRTGNERDIRQALETLENVVPDYSWISLTDAQGRVVASTRESQLGLDFSQDRGWQALQGGAGAIIADMVRSAEDDGNSVVTFMASVRGPDGAWQGGLLARVSMPVFEDVFAQTVVALQSSWGTDLHLEYQFLNRSGDLLADSLLREEGLHNLQQLGVPSAQLVEQGPSSFVEELFARRQVNVVTGYARTKDFDAQGEMHWGILVRVDRLDILTPILAKIMKAGLVGGAVLIPLIGLLLWSSATLNRAWAQTQVEHNRALAAEARFLKVLDASPDAFVMTDSGGRIVYANHVIETAFGYRSEELLDQPVEILMPERYRPRHPELRSGYMKTPYPRPMGGAADLVGQHKDGHEFPVLISLSHVEIDSDLYVLCAIRDITQLKQAQDERERLSRNVWLLLDSTAEGLYGVDPAGRCTFVNRAGAAMLGYTSDELLGQPLHAMIHHSRLDGSPYPEDACAVERVCLTGQGCRLDDDVLWRKDGSAFSAEIDARPVYGDGALTGAVVSFTEISERKHAEQVLAAASAVLKERNVELIDARDQALAATRAKSTFLASMSHEIRTPMNAIIGMADLLQETTLSEDQQEYVHRFSRAANSLLELINDILDISKIESGNLELEAAPFDLQDLVDKTAELMAIRANAKQLELVAFVHPDVPAWVTGDPTRLRQVLVNLLGNAIKFTERGEVALRIEPDLGASGALRFSVSDTGIGIPADKLQGIFESFTQVDSSTTRKYGGTGLGLSISKELVELMGGVLRVESTPNLGSTFSFVVPLAAAAATTLASEQALTLAIVGRRILVVDDNDTNRLIVREHLGRFGAVLVEAADGAAALAALDGAARLGQPFALAILDYHMPDMNGLDLARAIRARPDSAALPLVLHTSEMRADSVKWARALGIASYAYKPISRKRLLASVAIAVGQTPSTVLPQDQSSGGLAPVSLPALRILLAEDLEDNREVVALFLKDTPYRLEMAENGSLAVQKFQEGAYDLVLMDIQMPVMDGYQATEAIRQWEKEQQRVPTPIVSLTANAFQEDVEKSLAAGCMAHLTKPIKKKALLEAIAEYGRGHDATTAPVKASVPAPPAPAGPTRILIVDDLEDNREVARLFLAGSGYVLEEVENGALAVERVKAGSCDLVLMDMQMPVMDGYTATRVIREWEQAHHRPPIPIVAVTADALKEDMQKGLEAGCTAYLTKPVKKKILLDAIQALTGSRPGVEAA